MSLRWIFAIYLRNINPSDRAKKNNRPVTQFTKRRNSLTAVSLLKRIMHHSSDIDPSSRLSFSDLLNDLEGNKIMINGCLCIALTIQKRSFDTGHFPLDSPYWSGSKSYERSSALQGLNTNEALSSTYWTTPLNKLCLGMMTGNTINWILVHTGHARSLRSLIADGQYRPTNLTLEVWRSLMPNSYLGDFSPKQGFMLA